MRPKHQAPGLRQVRWLSAVRYAAFRLCWPPTKVALLARAWLADDYNSVSWLEQQMIYPIWLLASGIGLAGYWVCMALLPAERVN